MLISHLASHPDTLAGSDYDWESDVSPLCSSDDFESSWDSCGALVAWDSQGDAYAIPSDFVDRVQGVYSEFGSLPPTAQAEFDSVAEYRDNLLAEVGAPVDLDAEQCTPIESQEDFRALCEAIDVEPYQREAYEHWIVSDWLAEKLAERGEMTGELFGLTLWGRGCTGQAIFLDRVICEIASDMGILAGQPNAWEG
ncbi:hypothetical protein [Aeoliella sp.]|uniref:hypothetical protein n=1 Tax=Aeoliella sp. TaxID=2795800 RepID=UPI003CCC062B